MKRLPPQAALTLARLDLAARLAAMKAEAGKLGLWKTLQALDAATNAVGWEIADLMTGRQAAPEPEILSMKEVRRWAAEIKEDPTRGAVTRGMFQDLLATAEHWHREADEAAHVAAVQAEELDTLVDVAEERDRLRALVAGMREALGDWQKWEADIIRDDRCWSGSVPTIEQKHLDALTPLQDALTDLLADPDGLRAYELAANNREDARKYRALESESAAILKRDPELVADLAAAAAEFAEREEELRLLRELERTSATLQAMKGTGKDPCKAWRDHDDALSMLAALRTRQKGGPK